MNQLIKEITIDCLVNPSITNSSSKTTNQIKLKEKKFYKKRILYHTQKWLEEKEEFANQDIQKAFDKYVRCMIQHFKTTDFNDILQEEFKDLDEFISSTEEEYKEEDINVEDPNTIMMRSFPIIEQKKKSTLDSFVKKIEREGEQEETIFIPLRKKINLKEPSLKTKGIEPSPSKK
jgi:hypothetical protein